MNADRQSILQCVFIFFLAIFLTGCLDDSLQQLPVIEIAKPFQEQPFQYQDSVVINRGFLYRKLTEQGYDELHGLARFDFSKLGHGDLFDYDPLLLSCKKGGSTIRLLVTVHRSYKSILDILAIDPSAQEILQIYPNEDGGSIAVDLVERSEFALDRQQIFKFAIDQKGQFVQE